MMLSQVEKCTEFIRNLKIKDVSGSRRKSLVKYAEVLLKEPEQIIAAASVERCPEFPRLLLTSVQVSLSR